MVNGRFGKKLLPARTRAQGNLDLLIGNEEAKNFGEDEESFDRVPKKQQKGVIKRGGNKLMIFNEPSEVEQHRE